MSPLDSFSQQILTSIAYSPPCFDGKTTWQEAIAVLLSVSKKHGVMEKEAFFFGDPIPEGIINFVTLLKAAIAIQADQILNKITLAELGLIPPNIIEKDQLSDFLSILDLFTATKTNTLLIREKINSFGLLSKEQLVLALTLEKVLEKFFQTLKLHRILNRNSPSVPLTMPLLKVAQTLANQELTALVVLEPTTEQPVGIVQTLTLLEGLQQDPRFLTQPLEAVLQPLIHCLDINHSLVEAQNLWRENPRTLITVTEGKQWVGSLYPADLLKVFTARNLLEIALGSFQEQALNDSVLAEIPTCITKEKSHPISLPVNLGTENPLPFAEAHPLLDSIANNIPGLAYLVNYQSNTIVYHNHQAAELLGYSDREIEDLGANFVTILIHPEDREQEFQQWQLAMKQTSFSHAEHSDNHIWSLQVRLKDKQGYFKWFLLRQTIYERDEQGQVRLAAGLALDIHELKLTEELLHLTEERLRFLLESSPVVIYSCEPTPNLDCTYISKNVKQILGYGSGEFLSSYGLWLRRIHPEDRARVLGGLNYLLEKNSNLLEYRFQHRAGHYLWVRDERRLVRDARGNAKEVIGSVVDISDRKAMELALKTSEKHLSTIVSNISDGIIILDQQGHIHFANPMASKMFNLKPSEINDFVINLPTNPEENWEMAIAQKDGQVGIAEVKMSWVTWEGEARHLMAIRDVTRRRADAQKIKQSTERELLLGVIAQRIRQSLDLEEILNTTVEEVRRILNCDRVLVYRVYPQGTGKAIAESVGDKWEKILDRVFPEEVFPLECYEPYYQGRLFVLNDRRRVPEQGKIRDCLADFLSSIQVQAKLVVPILQPDCLWGLLIAHQCSGTRQWEAWEIDFLRQLSNQLTLAIQQSLLLKKLQEELTERQQIQNQLISVSQLQQGILDGANYSIISTNVNGIIQSFNRGAEKLLGYQAEEVVGKVTVAQFHDSQEIEYRAEILSQELGRTINADFEVFSAKAALGQVDEQEWTYIHKDGSRIDVLLCITGLFDQQGNCNGFVGIANNISDRKAIEAERQKLEFLVKKSSEFISITDLEGHLIFLNEAGQKLVGLPNLQAALKTCICDYHSPEVFKFLNKEIYPIILKTGHWEGESSIRHFVTQETIPVLLTVFVIQDSQTGQPTHLVGIMHDITDLKKAENNMRLALEQEQELGELRSRFIAMASHEFRTPLSIIASSTEIIEKYHQRLTLEKQAQHLHRIQTSVQHMTRLLDDVLLVSRAEANKLPFNPILQNIKELCQQLVEELRLSTNDQSLRLITKAPGPANADKWQISCDPKLMRQILTNLLSNAIKYSTQGGEIQIRLNREAGQTILQVKDHGIGIPAEDLARLFTPFHRANNVGTIQGTGLGLSIVQKCVELHGGKITVKSEIGKGTCFTVTIPDLSLTASSD